MSRTWLDRSHALPDRRQVVVPTEPDRRADSRAAGGGDRRASCRYPVVANRSTLRWQSDSRVAAEAPARLLDISSGGALAWVGGEPPIGARAEFRMEWPGPTDWLQVELVREAFDPDGSRLVGLRFADSCPYELFKAAVEGFQGLEAPPHPHPEGSAG